MGGVGEETMLTLVILNKLRCHAHFQFSANQITWSRLLIQIHTLKGKPCRSRSVGFWIYTVCKGMACPGSAGQGLKKKDKLFYFYIFSCHTCKQITDKLGLLISRTDVCYFSESPCNSFATMGNMTFNQHSSFALSANHSRMKILYQV